MCIFIVIFFIYLSYNSQILCLRYFDLCINIITIIIGERKNLNRHSFFFNNYIYGIRVLSIYISRYLLRRWIFNWKYIYFNFQVRDQASKLITYIKKSIKKKRVFLNGLKICVTELREKELLIEFLKYNTAKFLFFHFMF